MDYEAPKEHNPEYANVSRWSLHYTCRCGQDSFISTEARYIRQTCRDCGAVWEIAPSLTDATPYVAGTAAPTGPEQPEGTYELIHTVQGIAHAQSLIRWELRHHSHHIHSEQVGTLEARIPDLGEYYSKDRGPTPK